MTTANRQVPAPKRMTYVQAGRIFRIRKAMAGQYDFEDILGVDLSYISNFEEVSHYRYGSCFVDFIEKNRDLIQLYEEDVA